MSIEVTDLFTQNGNISADGVAGTGGGGGGSGGSVVISSKDMVGGGVISVSGGSSSSSGGGGGGGGRVFLDITGTYNYTGKHALMGGVSSAGGQSGGQVRPTFSRSRVVCSSPT